MLDVGSCLTRAGYGGDDIPKAIFPSVCAGEGWRRNSTCIAQKALLCVSCALCPMHLCPCGHASPGPCTQSVGCISATADGMEVDGQAIPSKRQLFIGQDGVNVKRENMEVWGAGAKESYQVSGGGMPVVRHDTPAPLSRVLDMFSS